MQRFRSNEEVRKYYDPVSYKRKKKLRRSLRVDRHQRLVTGKGDAAGRRAGGREGARNRRIAEGHVCVCVCVTAHQLSCSVYPMITETQQNIEQ